MSKLKPKVSEHEVQSAILDWLKVKRIFHYRQNTGGARLNGFHVRFGVPGAPDIVAVVKGSFVGIEVKKRGESQSEKQKEFEINLNRAGGKYILAYALEDVIKVLEN